MTIEMEPHLQTNQTRETRPANFVLAGGGTGGHIIPALAVARELRRRGHHVSFVGTTRGLEAKLVPAEGFEFKTIEIGGLNRVGLRQRLTTLLQLPISTMASRKFVAHASAIFSMGGYVAGPPVIAALLARTPVVVMEPNAIPGFTNRKIARFVARALISFPETARFFPPGRTELTGVPVREEFFQIAPKPRTHALHILITGGSQGSRTLNQAARQSWPLFQKSAMPVRIVHQTGRTNHEEIAADFARTGLDGEVVPFISNMPDAFAAADLIICRSGAGTIAELAAAGKASILVPFPFAADDHQSHNAEAMQRGGAGRVIRDAEMTGEKLFAAVTEVAQSPGTLEQMGVSARKLAKPGAAQRAADILEGLANA